MHDLHFLVRIIMLEAQVPPMNSITGADALDALIFQKRANRHDAFPTLALPA